MIKEYYARHNIIINRMSIVLSILLMAFYLYGNEWVGFALLMTNIVFVFSILALINKIPAWSLLPLSVLLGPLFELILKELEPVFLDLTRIFIENAVNPQYALVISFLTLFSLTVFSLISTRRLRYVFIGIFLSANILAISVFHHTQVNSFIDLQEERLNNQVNLLVANLRSTGFNKIDYICRLHGLKCLYGHGKESVEGIDPQFEEMFNQALSSPEPTYRWMIKFDSENVDAEKAATYQLYVYQEDGDWIYIDDRNIITPFYFAARKNFSILYSTFSVVWILILAFVLIRHKHLLNNKISLSS